MSFLIKPLTISIFLLDPFEVEKIFGILFAIMEFEI